ncbi:MAG: 2,3-bisphosphoglycerate-independent phosphoglycerate mutase [Candidatus Sungbacteria bacterium]|uniref:2,3-bisphosphoglycerate-independent phosphoglycerate mutase n=1 Tax=Candidatus Sungiibacteriota bacterium TaxID=2750080 RepID=A0A931SDH6_9BACT|nr:2,3-bisphosphoglycerate-independent phosphoglycerate mutase [Candidatus Sungbacteria bacterium]
MKLRTYKPVALVVMDGFGVSLEEKANAVALAKKPTLDTLDTYYPFTTLQASGIAVGLPWGERGNSEVGHLTMGAGRVIYHSLPRITNDIQDGGFYRNEAFLKAIEHSKINNSKLHLIGLASSGSVHAYIEHLYALLRLLETHQVPRVYLHIVTDGKDAIPKEGEKFMAHLGERMAKEFPHVAIGSVIGRFFAMDRDEQWERTKKAYQLYAEGLGKAITGQVGDELRASYDLGVTDEFIEPAFIPDVTGAMPSVVEDKDAVIFTNFREDSMRQIVRAFAEPAFDAFPRKFMRNLLIVTMTEYERGMNTLVAFPPIEIHAPLARIISEAGMRQLHIAETEKYAHVTYFFNGGREKPFQNEERILVPSLTATHPDDVPEMKAAEITARVVSELPHYDFTLVNYANADMVGHSGNLEAAVKAVEAVDRSLGELLREVPKDGGVVIVTGDHGNVEAKRNPLTGEKLTEHSLNPVPFYIVGEDFRLSIPRTPEGIRQRKREIGGILTDVAPTIIELLGLRKPPEMTGGSLLRLLRGQMSAN